MTSRGDPHDLILRPAGPADQPLLDEVAWMAHTWRQEPHPPMPDAMPRRTAAAAEGFGRPGDEGVVAVSGAELAGAAWWRYRTADDPGYGYLADDIPEVTVAVRPGFRRRGVASAMLAWLVARAAERDVRALSLSVEPDNPALRIYRRAGFEIVGEAEGALTLRLTAGPG